MLQHFSVWFGAGGCLSWPGGHPRPPRPPHKVVLLFLLLFVHVLLVFQFHWLLLQTSLYIRLAQVLWVLGVLDTEIYQVQVGACVVHSSRSVYVSYTMAYFFLMIWTLSHDRPGPCFVSSFFCFLYVCMYVCVWRRRWFLQNWSSLTKLFWTFLETGRGRWCPCGDVPGVAPLCPTLALVTAVVLRRLPDPLLDVVMVTPQPWCGWASATATMSL